MRRKTLPALSFTTVLLWCAVFFTVTILQFGCSSSNDDGDKSATENWIAMDIKFKASTTDEMRDVSIKAIEKLVVDSLTAMRSGRYPNFSPTIKISKNPFGDTLDYQFNVQHTAPSDTISNPTCKCINQCGVCLIITNYVHNSSDTSGTPAPYRNIEEISFREDDDNE
jgi:hypothetical protein